MNDEKDWVTGNITLSIGGRPLKIEMKAPSQPVEARRMLPVFRKITDSFVQFGIDDAISKGESISCKAGCGACCRQPVPISETEAHDLAAFVESMDEPNRSEIKSRFDKAVSSLSADGWFAKLEALPDDAPRERSNLALEYFQKGIPCPFLENESCSIHEVRPLACREYLVTTPSENCSDPTAETIKTVDLPATPSYIFRLVSKKSSKSKGRDYLPLVSAMNFASEAKESARKRTGEQWLSEFFKKLAKSKIPSGPKKDVSNT